MTNEPEPMDADPDPLDPTVALWRQASRMMDAKQFSQAKEAFEKLKADALTENPDVQTNDLYQAVVRQLAYIDYKRGDTESAIAYFLESQVFFPNELDIYGSLTHIARKQGRGRLYFLTMSRFRQNFKGVMRERIRYHRERLDREELEHAASSHAKPG